jgi:hypothetical protein
MDNAGFHKTQHVKYEIMKTDICHTVLSTIQSNRQTI